ncbi:hypothetical protein IJH27_00450 [Candidatus Saccharibacteria bacterium]|nr:hypothetical protein [Candidatus Saccharibacteria bacterium]
MSPKTNTSDEPSKKTGPRNLSLLALGAILITFLFTFITLKIYHDSGDIYLDRSRPGFLPEKEEIEKDKDDADYFFPDSGKLTKTILDEYLENLKKELDRLNDFSSNPFSPSALSNESLGI